MKKINLSFLALGLLIHSFAQDDYKKLPSMGVRFFLNDFPTAAEIRSGGLSSVIASGNWSKTGRMNPGLAFSYMQGLESHLDFTATASGSFLSYPVPGKTTFGDNELLLDVTAVVNLKLLTDKYTVSPYLTLGAGASKSGGYYGAFIPAGVGLQFNIAKAGFLLVNSLYRVPVTENVAHHLYHSIGFAGNIVKRKVAALAPVPPPPLAEELKDRDKDGVSDENDKCPDIPGLVALLGCPDKDGDNIADAEDKCPAVPGSTKYEGCPVPDTDKDGVNDENDKCVDVPGVARFQGCPVPDTDKDGVNDEDDRCPSEAGTAANLGCPAIEPVTVEKVNKAARNIFFATGSAKLLAKSNASLNSVVGILNANPTYEVIIDGHTDITGTPAKNQVLSEARANSVKAYFVSKGIDESRVAATGYGIDKPVATDKTVAGRAKNRRVEMTLRNY